MTPENSKKIADYIIRVIDLIKDCAEVYQVQLDNGYENRYCVAYHETNDDEPCSKLLMYSSEDDGIKLVFSQLTKKQYLSLGFEKDEYFNCSLKNDLVLDYENLKRVLDRFCSTEGIIIIRMKYSIIEGILKGEIDEHSPVSFG